MTTNYFLVICGQEIEVTGLGTFSIGREGDIKVGEGDLTISRKHCLIALPKKWPKNDACWLFDISKNGCFVNGRSITKGQERATRLFHSDIIQIRSIEIKFIFTKNNSMDCLGTLS